MTRRILIAEDSRTQAERLRLLLEEAGYAVEVARDGQDGLEQVRRQPPDLIISDLMMSRLDGYGFCRAVKGNDRTRRIPFVLLTERKDPIDIVKGLERGADNFITKPFDDAYLLERVRRIFEHLALRRAGHLEMEVMLHAGGRQISISADRQQIVELLFSTFEELCQLNGQLAASKRTVEDYAKDLERRVDERTRELRSLFDNVPIGLYRANLTGELLDANPAMVQMLGYRDRDALLRASATSFYVDGGDRARLHELLETQAVVRDYETQFRRQDGSTIWVMHHVRALRDTDGRTVGHEGAAQDITPHKEAQAEVKRQRVTLHQSEKLAAMGSLLAGVAHELNNPLSVVLGRAALLRESIKEGPLGASVEKLHQAAERCARIVKNFLALARHRPPERRPTDLNTVLREAVELVAYQLRVDMVEVDFQLAPALPRLSADPHQLHQVAVNLIVNAHHAMQGSPPPRRLTLRTWHEPDAGAVAFTVTDTGPGVPPEIQDRIFEPFFTTKPAGMGTGLGLSLCHGMIAEHGGRITVSNDPAGGAVVRVDLPLGAPAASAARPAQPGPAVRGERRRILVVDDEREVAEVLADMLGLMGHQVATASNGADALDRLRAEPFDLVFSDLRMPTMDGPDLYRELERTHPGLARRFIFVTGDTLGDEIRAMLETSRALTIGKPFALDEVRQIVAQALRRSDG